MTPARDRATIPTADADTGTPAPATGWDEAAPDLTLDPAFLRAQTRENRRVVGQLVFLWRSWALAWMFPAFYFLANLATDPPQTTQSTLLIAAIFLTSSAISYFAILASRQIKNHLDRDWCRLVASLNCLLFPLGTLLGLYTLKQLNRPSIRELYHSKPVELPPFQPRR